jgi:hypothetical protein
VIKAIIDLTPRSSLLSPALSAWAVALAMGTGTAALAQKVVGPEEYDRAMKTIGTAFDGVVKSIESKSYVEAKTPLALSRQILASTRPLWETSQKPDAAKMTRQSVAALDALDKALSARAIDATAVAAALRDATRSCDACHAIHREGDEQTGYRIKSTVR